MTGPNLAAAPAQATTLAVCGGGAAAGVALMWVLPAPVAAVLVVGVAAVAVLAGWDAWTRRLPNTGTAALAAAGLVAAGGLLLAGQIPSMWPAVAGLAIFGVVGFLEALPQDALGGGDAKLLAAIGAWTGLLGWAALLPTLLFTHLVMLVTLAVGRFRSGGGRVVMGPAIAVGMVVGWLAASLPV